MALTNEDRGFLRKLIQKNNTTLSKISCALGGGSPATSSSDIEIVCRCDNTGAAIVPFVSAYSRTYDATTTTFTNTLIGHYTDETLDTPYTPIAPQDCASVGADTEWKQGRIELTAGSWSPTALIRKYTIVASGAGSGSYTDSFGNVTTIATGDTSSWGDDDSIIDTGAIVASTGLRIIITYTSY